VLDVDTGDVLSERIAHTRACSVAWDADEAGFVYTRYPPDDEYHRTVFHHTLGADPQADPVVWDRLPTPQSWPEVRSSPDGRYLLVEVMVGWGHVEVHLHDRSTDTWQEVISGHEAVSAFAFAGDLLVGMTTLGASRGRIVVAPLATPGVDHWRTIVPERDAVLARPVPCGEEILVPATTRAVDHIERYALDGARRGSVDGLGTVAIVSITADPHGTDLPRAFITTTGFTRPPSIWRWTAADGLVPWSGGPAVAEASALAVRQVHYRSADGTEVGMFLIHAAGAEPGPSTPAILNGYGGFGITETPIWSPMIAAWCEAGGLYAIAGLRGGLEEGEAWHDAGRRGNKQNVFDDFHAAGEWLVEQGLTSPERLGIAGGSNGGLLVAAALTQRPDAYRAVWCAVPLCDMVRFPQFLIARLWTDEYGDPDVAEEFAWLWAYSPYHRVVEGTAYPAVLVTTADRDTRVDPLHARKMAAALQWASSVQAERPVLLYQEGRAGHGVGKPVGKRADEAADVLAFMAWQLGVS
jgi:prolyl oligopeptidase